MINPSTCIYYVVILALFTRHTLHMIETLYCEQSNMLTFFEVLVLECMEINLVRQCFRW